MPKKITENEFQEVQDLRRSVSEVVANLGDLNYQKTVLELMLEEQKAKVAEIKRREIDFFERIKSTYGPVTVNIETGEIE